MYVREAIPSLRKLIFKKNILMKYMYVYRLNDRYIKICIDIGLIR